MSVPCLAAWTLLSGLLCGGSLRQEAVDPQLQAAVERFFATQQAEDVDGYLSLWSAAGLRARPQLQQLLNYVFDSGDDVFSQIEIAKVMPFGDRMRVRVSATRERTEKPRVEGGPPVVRNTRMQASLTFVREGSDWKLLREGPATDDLAQALIETPSAQDRAALLGAEPELLTDRLLMSLSRLAGDQAQQGRHGAAQAGYERMLEVARHIKDRKYEAEALQNLGNTFYFQQNLPAALDAYEQRLAIERERANDEGIAAALSGIATIRYASAEYSAALTAYRDALAIQERLGDDALIATSLISTGNVLYLQGDFEGAVRDYARSRDLSRKLVHPAGESRALEGLGRVYLASGDIAGALEAFTGVLQEAIARGDRVAQGNASLSLGEAHYRLGNVDVARRTFDESRLHFEASKDSANAGRAWQAVALMDLVAGRFALAEEGYVRSRASCGSVTDMPCAAAATAGLAFAQAAQEKFADAIKGYRQALEQFTGLKAREQMARTNIGLSHALSGGGDQKGAIAAAVDARHVGIAIANDDIVWRALVSEARALRKLGERDAALAAARAALGAVNTLVEDSRTRPGSPVPRDTASVLATLAVLYAEAGDAAAAFDAIERMRVHDLRLGLAPAEREIARGMSAAERDEERAIAIELVTLHARLAREKQLPKPDAARVTTLETALAEAAARRAAQQKALFERLPELRTWRGLIDPVPSTELAGVLRDGDTVLQFALDEKDVVVLTAARRDHEVRLAAYVRPVTRQKIAEHVARLISPDVLKDAAEWRRAAGAFLLDVMPPEAVERVKEAGRLIIVPHEILWRVPFDALPIADKYLGDTTPVTCASSITALARVPPRVAADATGADAGRTLTASSPVVAESVLARLQQTSPGWTLRDPADAASEVTRVVGDEPAERITSVSAADATESAVREHLPGADVIHLALPFRINGAGALFSPLLLAGEPVGNPPEAANDARLDARDVMNLTLSGRLAVLSDPSAMSMRDAADEAALVHWAWRAAGVPALMMARWRTDAAAAGDLLAAFHQRVRAGEEPGRALRAAQAAVRTAEGRSAPFFWAGWILIGVP
jgi:tetratricopeptide (TPR) repeat protein